MSATRINATKAVTPTRNIGTAGDARAFRVGDVLIVAGHYSGVSLSSTYAWASVCTVPLTSFGASSLTMLGVWCDVSGGGPSYQGFDNNSTGGDIVKSGSNAVVRMQTRAAISSKIVRFMAFALLS